MKNFSHFERVAAFIPLTGNPSQSPAVTCPGNHFARAFRSPLLTFLLTAAPSRNTIGEQKANHESSPLFPLLQKSPLVGIAASRGGRIFARGHNVEYFTLPARSLLNRCTGVRMPFTWTINPYRGCEFACKYCYARLYSRIHGNARRRGVRAENLRQAAHGGFVAARFASRQARESIALGTATDPISRRSDAMRLREEFSRSSLATADSSWALSPIQSHRSRSGSLARHLAE